MTRRTQSQATAVKMIQEAISGMAGRDVVNTICALVSDHPEVTPEDLEHLSNQFGRQVHQLMRERA